MSKLNREQRLRERRVEKQMRKEDRKLDGPEVVDPAEGPEDLAHLDRYVDPFAGQSVLATPRGK